MYHTTHTYIHTCTFMSSQLKHASDRVQDKRAVRNRKKRFSQGFVRHPPTFAQWECAVVCSLISISVRPDSGLVTHAVLYIYMAFVLFVRRNFFNEAILNDLCPSSVLIHWNYISKTRAEEGESSAELAWRCSRALYVAIWQESRVSSIPAVVRRTREQCTCEWTALEWTKWRIPHPRASSACHSTTPPFLRTRPAHMLISQPRLEGAEQRVRP